MPVQLIWSNGVEREIDAIQNLMMAHRQSIIRVECICRDIMENEADASTFRRGVMLDRAEEAEKTIRAKLAAASVGTIEDARIKAAHFRQLISAGRCDFEIADVLAFLESIELIQLEKRSNPAQG
ncbi:MULTISPECIES: hypothetical protein [Brucella]|uniref:Uncharacterized protein n=1 Tax=Brucella tritici TaxID=94626 RepID=A0A6L3YB39_9HYPH|nr:MULTISPECIES: hypothetical protein [Brucella]KAB2681177.1 hypothetical protein F9L08_19965 [Brucella tritici]KAB2757341.1 hypothetical protein F9K98_23370 [Brucella anthropi]KAB2775270.1 hypothetical protein F9K99_22745 [Brucella anthropi]